MLLRAWSNILAVLPASLLLVAMADTQQSHNPTIRRSDDPTIRACCQILPRQIAPRGCRARTSAAHTSEADALKWST